MAKDGNDQDLSEKERLELRQRYYNTASGVGALLSDLFRAQDQLGTATSSQHYRCMVGAGLIASALHELHALDSEVAKPVFDELTIGLKGLGERLGLAKQARHSADKVDDELGDDNNEGEAIVTH